MTPLALLVFAQVTTTAGPADALSPGLSALVGSLGPTGGVVVVVVYFLRHLTRRDGRQQKWEEVVVDRMEKLVDRVDAMEEANRAVSQKVADEFTATTRELNTEYRRTVDALVGVHRSTGETLGAVSGRVTELTSQVVRLSDLADQVARLSAVTADLAQRIDRFDATPRRGRG